MRVPHTLHAGSGCAEEICECSPVQRSMANSVRRARFAWPERILRASAVCSEAAKLTAAGAQVHRGDLVVHIKVSGTVVPEDVFRLKSTIAGRIESINPSSFSWRGADEPLAMLAHKELAAMIDARGGQDQSIMEDRWDRVYRPTPIRCPAPTWSSR